jgi:CRISPR-associated endonuclease/helicase Cas3
LDPRRKEFDWTLIATSCVEAGVDISFRVGFRERAGLTNLLQTTGRVNRSNEYGSAEVWDFQLTSGELVAANPGIKDAASILGQLFAEGKVTPAWCTEALRREIQQLYSADLHEGLRKAEEALDFPAVEKQFRVIEEDTVTAVVKDSLIQRLQNGDQVDWQDIQRGSVSLYRKKASKFRLPADEYPQFPGLHRWNLEYDGFLGYMAGALPFLKNEDPTTAGLLCI